ncbi:MAG: nucleotidyltransferase domain-containing protein [Anaerolineae bacterium]|nr:nucleotidyltransferase domain-containing protein [Anaerolineae bacterium]
MWSQKVFLPVVLPAEAELARFCQERRIRKLSLFGSVLRGGDFHADSDLDVLVEFEPDAHVGWNIVTIEDELSALLGRAVDLNTPTSLSPYFRQKVLDGALVLYG